MQSIYRKSLLEISIKVKKYHILKNVIHVIYSKINFLEIDGYVTTLINEIFHVELGYPDK